MFYTVFDSQYIVFSITNICTLLKNQCCVGVIPPAKNSIDTAWDRVSKFISSYWEKNDEKNEMMMLLLYKIECTIDE